MLRFHLDSAALASVAGDALAAMDPLWALLLGALAGGLIATAAAVVRRRSAHLAERALLHPLAADGTRVSVFLRGLFVPGGEFFSRAPEDPRNPAGGVTVHKWPKIPEVHSGPDVQAASTVISLLAAHCPGSPVTLLVGDAGRQAWSDHAIAIGPHYMAYQILDGCEPRLVAVRQPAAFRMLPMGEVFEPKEGLDLGLIYKGQRVTTHRTFYVVMGLGDAGTVAAARFLQSHAAVLGRLFGKGAFAVVIAADSTKGPERTVLRALNPKPSWWRRLRYRKEWQALGGGSSIRA